MRKIILTIIITFFVINNNFAQPAPPVETTPPNKTRSNGTFTEIDHHLKVTKRFGIPTATTDNLFATTSTPIIFNSTSKTLRLFDNNQWIDIFGYQDLKMYDGAAIEFGSLKLYDNEFFIKTASTDNLFVVGYNYLEVFDIDGNKSFSFAQAGTDITTDVQLFITPKNGKLPTINTVAPSSSTDTGVYGEIRVTSTYIYFCIATDTWVRYAVENTF
jgi:hypothetical protein